MKETPSGFPKRLVDSGDPAGEAIRASLRAPVRGPSESQSFRRVSKQVRRRSARAKLSLAGVALVAALGAVVSIERAREADTAPIRAEHSFSAPSRRPPAPRAAATELVQPVREAPALPTPSVEPRRKEPESDTSRCATLARAGSYEAAAACYDRIARGRGMAAELALYEKARVESKALGNSAAALGTLEEHARRFPSGVLATESNITRIELLSRLGRTGEALRATEQALQGPAGRERGGDLQVLRADLLAARGDCAAAREAVAQARKAGAHAARLEASERRCPAVPTADPAPTPPSLQDIGKQ